MATQFNCRLNNNITSEYFEDTDGDTLNIPAEFTCIQPKNAQSKFILISLIFIKNDFFLLQVTNSIMECVL